MENKDKIILITWASWFIWGNLVRSLVEKWFTNINIIVRETSNLWRLNDVKEKININYEFRKYIRKNYRYCNFFNFYYNFIFIV